MKFWKSNLYITCACTHLESLSAFEIKLNRAISKLVPIWGNNYFKYVSNSKMRTALISRKIFVHQCLLIRASTLTSPCKHLFYWLHISSINFSRFKGVQSQSEVLQKIDVLEIWAKSLKNNCQEEIHIMSVKMQAPCLELNKNVVLLSNFSRILPIF